MLGGELSMALQSMHIVVSTEIIVIRTAIEIEIKIDPIF
jgi:hypothetical protein